MKIYCSCCDKVQPVRIDNCRDAKTNEPFQDIVCATCDLVIASGTDIAQQQEPVAYDKTEMNCFVQDLYDKKMKEGKHGHYETMFHVVHQAIKRVPPATKPLSDEEIENLWQNTSPYYDYQDFARAIEAAHGIKGNA